MEGVHEHGDFLDVGDVPVEGLLARAGGGAKRDAILVGGLADIAGRLKMFAATTLPMETR
ncbi:MAG: hypothetical protein ACLSDQ_09955 [Adlercreutzia equolifaciens]